MLCHLCTVSRVWETSKPGTPLTETLFAATQISSEWRWGDWWACFHKASSQRLYSLGKHQRMFMWVQLAPSLQQSSLYNYLCLTMVLINPGHSFCLDGKHLFYGPTRFSMCGALGLHEGSGKCFFSNPWPSVHTTFWGPPHGRLPVVMKRQGRTEKCIQASPLW